MSMQPGPILCRRQWLATVGATLASSALASSRALAAAGRPVLRMAVVPQLTPVEVVRYWTPVMDVLGSNGMAVELAVYPSIAAFEPEFLKGKADLVYLNPYHMVMAHKAHAYVPLLRDTRPLEGVLVVRQDSPVVRIEQLKDHRISFPAPNAFAASLYMRSVLERQFHLQFDAHYAGNHRNAIHQVLIGDSAAAGIVKNTFEKEPPNVQKNLRVLYTTPAVPPHPLAVHPRVPKAVRENLVDILRALAANPETKSQMAAINMPDPVLAHYARDYAPLEKLRIEKYVVAE